MIDVQEELEELRSNTACLRVLRLYHDLANEQARKARQTSKNDESGESNDSSRWLPRLEALDDIEIQELSAIHGQLIALGFLKFRVESRTTGLQYQLSPLARHALTGDSETAAEAA